MLTFHSCAVTELHRMRHCRAVPAVLAIPAVPIEKNEMVGDRSGLAFFPDPEQALHRRACSALALRVEFFNTKRGWSCHGACCGAALTLSTFDRGLFRHGGLLFRRTSFAGLSLQFCHFRVARAPCGRGWFRCFFGITKLVKTTGKVNENRLCFYRPDGTMVARWRSLGRWERSLASLAWRDAPSSFASRTAITSQAKRASASRPRLRRARLTD